MKFNILKIYYGNALKPPFWGNAVEIKIFFNGQSGRSGQSGRKRFF